MGWARKEVLCAEEEKGEEVISWSMLLFMVLRGFQNDEARLFLSLLDEDSLVSDWFGGHLQWCQQHGNNPRSGI